MVQVVGLIDEKYDGLMALRDDLDELAFAFLGLGRDLEVFLGHQVIEQGSHQGAEVDSVLIDGQRLGDQDILVALQALDQTVEGRGLAAADESDQSKKLSTMDSCLDVVEHLAQLLGLEVAGSG